ncbi:MAG: leucine-rich repeat domain-containing protein, partial [Polyangiales bacterium]
MKRATALFLATVSLAIPSIAHAIVECDTRVGDPNIVDECHVTQVSDNEKAELAKKPRRTLMVWMDAPSKSAVETLANAPWIEQLTLYDTSILGGTKTKLDDLSPLRALTKLRRLTVGFGSLVDLDFVSSLDDLEYLDIGGANIKKDIAPLATRNKLVELHIIVNGTQAKVVGQMAKLERLDIAGVESLDVLAKQTKLTTLKVVMSSMPGPKSTAGLGAMTGMKSLRIISFQLDDLVGLKNMTVLEEVDVSGTKVANLAPIAGATKLRSLYVNGTKVSSLAPLAKISTLETVDVRDTAVTDFSPLMASAKSLKHLYVPASTPKSAVAALVAVNP